MEKKETAQGGQVDFKEKTSEGKITNGRILNLQDAIIAFEDYLLTSCCILQLNTCEQTPQSRWEP